MSRVNKHFEAAKKLVESSIDNNTLNLLIYSIWATELYPVQPLPGFVPSVKKNTLLILGSNPSFNPGGYREQLSKSKYPDIRELKEYREFRNFIFQSETGPMREEEDILELSNKVCRMDESIGDNGHVYVKRLYKFGVEPTGLSINDVAWWDMCCLRMNDQSDLDLFLKNNPKIKWTLLLIALRFITIHEPKMILLPNSGAAAYLQSVLKLAGGSMEFSQEFGTRVLEFEHIRCPIFLSANLHSRNQLDAYSKERFSWHVGWVWEKLKANSKQ